MGSFMINIYCHYYYSYMCFVIFQFVLRPTSLMYSVSPQHTQ